MKVTNILSSISIKQNLYLESEIIARVNMTFEKLDDRQIVMTLESAQSMDMDSMIAGGVVKSILSLSSLELYSDKIANYSFACTVIVVWAFSVLMA